ncbi:hypothetical protein BH09DEP1_BH09DEP1_5550 [soil metagenome]
MIKGDLSDVALAKSEVCSSYETLTKSEVGASPTLLGWTAKRRTSRLSKCTLLKSEIILAIQILNPHLNLKISANRYFQQRFLLDIVLHFLQHIHSELVEE